MLKKGTLVKTISNEYTILEQVTQGGNGTIFRVSDDTGNTFALKAIDRDKTTKQKLKRFQNEIAFCSRYYHPHIVQVLDSGTHNSGSKDIVFYIMPFYPQTLRDLITSGISGNRALELFTEISDGLKFAHQKEVWHRDIKPENILIDRDGHAVIADFGIAHFQEDELATVVETRKQDRLANFQYAAPEQRNRGQDVDGRADVFALGLILNEMFTKSIISGVNYRTIAEVDSEYGYLDEVVSKLICQKPEDRLFPVSTIAIEILALQKKAENEKELQRLAISHPESDLDDGVIETPDVVDITYENGCLYLKLSGLPRNREDAWLSCLIGDSYTRSYILGYEPKKLRLIEGNLVMPAHNESVDGMKPIIESILRWLPPATDIYNRRVREINKHAQQEEEWRIQHEIRQRETNSALKDVLRELK